MDGGNDNSIFWKMKKKVVFKKRRFVYVVYFYCIELHI